MAVRAMGLIVLLASNFEIRREIFSTIILKGAFPIPNIGYISQHGRFREKQVSHEAAIITKSLQE